MVQAYQPSSMLERRRPVTWARNHGLSLRVTMSRTKTEPITPERRGTQFHNLAPAPIKIAARVVEMKNPTPRHLSARA
jgi:hypothetical protein